jgi:hypothetical protein
VILHAFGDFQVSSINRVGKNIEGVGEQCCDELVVLLNVAKQQDALSLGQGVQNVNMLYIVGVGWICQGRDD